MLEEAIVDATALKEAAIKNAENVIVEKYSADIKEAVESLLEAEGDPDAEEDDEPSQVQNDIPVGAMPTDSEEEIVVNFEDLRKIADAIEEKEEETGQDLMGEPQSQEALSAMINSQEGDGATAPSLEPELPPSTSVTMALEENAKEELEEEEEEEEVDLEEVLDIMEELVVDIDPQKDGWVGTPDAIMDYKAEMMLARQASTASQEALKSQKELVDRLATENKKLKQVNDKYKKLIIEANSRIEKSNLTNARLLYTNRVMTNDSLNERQKTKIVEAVQNADSIEEAKTIFETLQNAVGGALRGSPKSLSESIERPVGSLPRRKRENSMETRVVDRMQILAGIKQQQ